MGDFTVTINGFKTLEQAREFYKWYDGQGEQDIQVWLECAECGAERMNVKSGSLQIVGNEVSFSVDVG